MCVCACVRVSWFRCSLGGWRQPEAAMGTAGNGRGSRGSADHAARIYIYIIYIMSARHAYGTLQHAPNVRACPACRATHPRPQANHITSHHITSHHITSHHTASHHITSHHTARAHARTWPAPLRCRPRRPPAASCPPGAPRCRWRPAPAAAGRAGRQPEGQGAAGQEGHAGSLQPSSACGCAGSSAAQQHSASLQGRLQAAARGPLHG